MAACPEPAELARVGYQAYGEWAAWRNYAGLPMPAWPDLPDAQRLAWVAAAGAIVHAVIRTPPG